MDSQQKSPLQALDEYLSKKPKEEVKQIIREVICKNAGIAFTESINNLDARQFEELISSKTKARIIEKATIEYARVSVEMGILTADVRVNFAGGSQSFGSWCLYNPEKGGLDSKNYAGHFLYRVLEITESNSLEEMAGKEIMIDHDHNGIYRIRSVNDDSWFDPKEDFKDK